MHGYTPSRTLQSEWRIREHMAEVMNTGVLGAHLPTLDGPLWLRLTVLLAPPQMPKKHQGTRLPAKRPDLDNYIKTVLDACQGILFADDSQVVRIYATKVYAWNEIAGWKFSIRTLAGQEDLVDRTRQSE